MAVIAGRALRIAGRPFQIHDLLLAGAGGAMLIAGLLPWYGYDAPGWHPAHSAFQSGFKAFFAVWIVALIAGAAATRAWTGSQRSHVGSTGLTWNALFLIGDALAALLIVLFWTTLPSLAGASTGAKFGAFAGMVIVLVQAAGALIGALSAGQQLAVEALTRRWRQRRQRPASG